MDVPGGDDCLDDGALSGDVKLLRRIPPDADHITTLDGEVRPASSNFDNHPDGSGTSVDIWESDWTPDSLLLNHEGYGVVSITVQHVRDAGLGVIRAPILPGNPHHALIQGKKTKSRRRALAKNATWQKMPMRLPR